MKVSKFLHTGCLCFGNSFYLCKNTHTYKTLLQKLYCISFLLFLFALSFTIDLQAQQKYFSNTYWWGRTHEGKRGIENADKCIIVAGNYTSVLGGNVHGYLLKLSALGDSIWHRNYQYLGEQTYFSYLIPVENGYAVTGVLHLTSDEYSYRGFLLKIDENG
ncbi:MAG TPA: hypothetical protein PK239_18705, partial [Chitinophagales bacterium]|nr:hypothetical protein [Chitinophagales bacterium]